MYIDPNTCIDCGLCVSLCPVKAIFQENKLPKHLEKWIEINATEYEKHPALTKENMTDPLPSAKTLAEVLKKEIEENGLVPDYDGS